MVEEWAENTKDGSDTDKPAFSRKAARDAASAAPEEGSEAELNVDDI